MVYFWSFYFNVKKHKDWYTGNSKLQTISINSFGNYTLSLVCDIIQAKVESPKRVGLTFAQNHNNLPHSRPQILLAINLRTHAHAYFAFSSLQSPITHLFSRPFCCLLSSVFWLRSTVFWGLPLEIFGKRGGFRSELVLCFRFQSVLFALLLFAAGKSELERTRIELNCANSFLWPKYNC